MSRFHRISPSKSSDPLCPIKANGGSDALSRLVMCCFCVATAMLLLLSGGCIHTYPKPDQTTDPTEISVDLLLGFSDEWGEIQSAVDRSLRSKQQGEPGSEAQVANRSDEWVRRVYVSLRAKNGTTTSFSTTLSESDLSDGRYRISLPSKLKADKYYVAVWADYLHPTTFAPLAYDISNPLLIRQLLPRGEETDARACFTATGEFDLTPLSGQWDASEEVALTLFSPMARLRLVAADYSDFLTHTAEARRRGEHYYVVVSYDSEIAGGFSLPDGMAMDPVERAAFTLDLPIITLPGIEMCIGSDWLFSPPMPYDYTVTVTVFNSAKVMVSQTAGINFSAERGKITNVRGRLLTNFVSGGITVDNLWDGVIVIEIP